MNSKYLDLNKQIKNISKKFFVNNPLERKKLEEFLSIFGYHNYIFPIKHLFTNYNEILVAKELDKQIKKYFSANHIEQMENKEQQEFWKNSAKWWKSFSKDSKFIYKKSNFFDMSRDFISINNLIKNDLEISKSLFSKLYFFEKNLKTSIGEIIGYEMSCQDKISDSNWAYFLYKSIKSDKWWEANINNKLNKETISNSNQENTEQNSLESLSKNYLKLILGEKNFEKIEKVQNDNVDKTIMKEIQKYLNINAVDKGYIWNNASDLNFGKLKFIFLFVILNFYKSDMFEKIFSNLLDFKYFSNLVKYLKSSNKNQNEIGQKLKKLESFLNFTIDLRNSIAHNNSILLFLFKYRDKRITNKIILEHKNNKSLESFKIVKFKKDEPGSFIEINGTKLYYFRFKIILKFSDSQFELYKDIANYLDELKKASSLDNIIVN